MAIFQYPDAPHVRRHGPCGYANYESYKPWLRDEFAFCCIYCRCRERWFPDGEADIFKAVADPEKKSALGAVVISGGKYPETDFAGLFRNNVIISNFSNVSLGGQYYGDGTNGRFVGNTFVRIGERKDYRTIQGGIPWGKRSSRGHVFIDSRFKGGAGYDKVKWRGDGEFAVGSTVTIKTVAGAKVTIKNKIGQVVFVGVANAKGIAKTVLIQFRHNDNGKTILTPHRITAEKNGTPIETQVHRLLNSAR